MASILQKNKELIRATLVFFFNGEDKKNTTIDCQFNPKEYVISKSNSWNTNEAKETTIGHQTFGGGQPATLKLQLLFDDYDIADGKAGTNLEASTKLLWRAMRPQETGEDRNPPKCQFCWGNVWTFMSAITSLSQKFVLFDSSGKPLRAIIDITLTQILDEDKRPKQNPTSGGGAGERIRVVRAGDTLVGIAFEEYGDPKVWRHLADTNKIRNPLRLNPGQELLITPLPLV